MDDLGTFRVFRATERNYGIDWCHVLRDHGSVGYTFCRNTLVVLPESFTSVIAVGEGYALIGRHLYIHVGCWFDGASGPAVDGVCNLMAAAVHDMLYRILESRHGCQLDPLDYAMADRTYADIMRAQGGNHWRVLLHYVGLRLFGRLYVAVVKTLKKEQKWIRIGR